MWVGTYCFLWHYYSRYEPGGIRLQSNSQPRQKALMATLKVRPLRNFVLILWISTVLWKISFTSMRICSVQPILWVFANCFAKVHLGEVIFVHVYLCVPADPVVLARKLPKWELRSLSVVIYTLKLTPPPYFILSDWFWKMLAAFKCAENLHSFCSGVVLILFRAMDEK